MERIIRRVTIALKTLGAVQIIAGSLAVLAIFRFVNQELLDVVGEEIMMDGKAIQITAILLMFLVIATGIVSVFRVKWGWVFSFTAATVVLLMGLLMGPATLPVTKWSFLGLMVLSLVNWAAAVVYYYHDLYT